MEKFILSKKERNQKKRRLQYRLTLNMSMIILLTAIVLTAVSAFFIRTSNMSTLEKSTYQTLDATSTAIERTLKTLLINAQSVASSETVKDSASSKEDKIAAMDKIRTTQNYDEVGFVELNGKGYSNLGDFDFNDQVHFQTAKEGQLFVGEPIVNRLNGDVILISSAPVYNEDKIVGTVYIVDTVASVNDMIAETAFGDTGYAYVLNSSGTVIYHKDVQQIVEGFNALEQSKEDPAYDSMSGAAQKIISGKKGITEYKLDGITRYVAYTPIKGYDTWFLAMDAPKSEFLKATTTSIAVSLIISAALLVVGIFFIFAVISRVVKPINGVTDRLALLAKGDLKTDVEIVGSNDEVGILSKSLRSTVESLNLYISEISGILNQISKGNLRVSSSVDFIGDFKDLKISVDTIIASLNRTLSEINMAADQVAGGSEQVSSGAQALSQGATEQASSAEQLAATINSISEQVKKTAEGAELANEKTKNASTETEFCNNQMQTLADAMADITEKSNEIGKIIKTIEDIAFQTNILALNAAVEAARAGTAGKGFAVVADEVRNLAAKSADAAKNTTAMIEDALRAVETGMTLTNQTAQSLNTLVGMTGDVSYAVHQINDAANMQADSITQITAGIDQIASVIQTNSATAEESAAASEELNGQSQLLKNTIHAFTLKDDYR